MDSEFRSAAARGHCLGEATDVVDCNHTLNLFLVDVDYGIVCDRNHSLLRPLELVDLFHQRGVHKSV